MSTPASSNETPEPDNEFRKAVRSSWARLLKKVYEVDPLTCPQCGDKMRFLAVIE